MSLRALLTQSFPFLRARTHAAAAGRRPRSFHTMRDLDVGVASYGTVAAAAAFAGLVGVLFNNDEELAGVTANDAMKEVLADKNNFPIRTAAMEAGFVFQDGTVDWYGYQEHLMCQRYNGGKPRYDKEEYDKDMDRLARRQEALDQEYAKVVLDEAEQAAMKARFNDWMKEYGRSYKNKEEEAWRYEIFKKTAIQADMSNASKQNGSRVAAPNGFADRTEEELNSTYIRFDDERWEMYLAKINSMWANEDVSKAAKKRAKE